MLYLSNVLTLNDEAEAVLSCPTSSHVPGTTGQLSKCQHVCLSDAWLYIFCCMFIYLIKMGVGKYNMVVLHCLFQEHQSLEMSQVPQLSAFA